MISSISFPFFDEIVVPFASNICRCLFIIPTTKLASIWNKIAAIYEQDPRNLRRKQSNKDGIHLI